MKTISQKSSHPFIPSYSENGALQLIIVSSVTFIIFHFTRVVMLILEMDKNEVYDILYSNIGISTLKTFVNKPWTLLTYGWIHRGFFDWFTNMVWVYCFGGILQSIAGYKQVIPLFFYSLIIGGLFYLGGEYLPFLQQGINNSEFVGAQAGVLALGIASLVLSPHYKLTISPNFSIPLILIIGIYLLLDLIVYIPDQLSALILCFGGALTGLLYAALVRNNYRPGEWIYDVLGRFQRLTTPDEAALSEKRGRKRKEVLRQMYEPKKGITQQKIDEILDKINENGYHSLSKEEKDILLRAGKD
jgi:membrane associated rhomboid family serine protease